MIPNSEELSFEAMVSNHNMIGIGCDENAAIWYRDSGLPCVKTSRSNATVKVLQVEGGAVSTEQYMNNDEIILP